MAFLPLWAGDPKLPIEENSNENVEVSGKLLRTREEIQQALGVTELPANFDTLILVRVRVRPLTDKPLQLSLDDFTLLCTKDGQRSKPFEPSEIAGASTLVLHRGTDASQKTGLSGGFYGLQIGNGKAPETVTATVEEKSGEKESPIMGALREKILAEKEIKDPASGLLYFQIEGKKLKSKDFEFIYHGPGGKLMLRFQPDPK